MSTLETALARWENGETTLEELELSHPETGVRDLVGLHTQLSMMGAVPLPDVDRGWNALRSNLPDRPTPALERLRSWARRPLLASVAAVVVSGGVAYAAGVEPVQRFVDGTWNVVLHGVAVLTGDGEESTSDKTDNDPVTDEGRDEKPEGISREGSDPKGGGDSDTDDRSGAGSLNGDSEVSDQDADGDGDDDSDDHSGPSGSQGSGGQDSDHDADEDADDPDTDSDDGDGVESGDDVEVEAPDDLDDSVEEPDHEVADSEVEEPDGH